MCGAVLLAMALFGFLVWDTLDGANDMIAAVAANRIDGDHTSTRINMPFHSIVIRIVSSYLQIAGMLLQFELQLPPSVRALIVVEASTSALSESLLSIDCATSIRNDAEIFLMKQLASVWGIPLCAMVVCGVFWWLAHTLVLRRKKSNMTGLDGFLSSLMVLFYTLFPSVVSRVATTFSCQNYGRGVHEKSLLTEALSVECYSSEHWSIIGWIGVPGILMYIVVAPTVIALMLVRQRKRQELYPSQKHYESKWTLRFGFMFAGYKEGYEWWESMVMLRKCCFVLLAIFLKQYGAAPQVVAASLVLVVALSASLQHLPYQDDKHNQIETIGIQACLLQLMVALLCNLMQGEGGKGDKGGHNRLGPNSTAVLIVVVFGSTLVFFGMAVRATVHGSLGTQGVVGKLARVMVRWCCIGQKKGNGGHRGEDRSLSLARVVPVQREEQERQQKTTLKKEIVALKWQKNIRRTLMKNNKPS